MGQERVVIKYTRREAAAYVILDQMDHEGLGEDVDFVVECRARLENLSEDALRELASQYPAVQARRTAST